MDWRGRVGFVKRNVRLPRLQKTAWLALLVVPAIGICAGQSDTAGSVAGRVVDEGGKGVSAALVRIENATTGEHSDSICDLRGDFRFAEVTPGGYTLRVHAEGLSEWEADNLEIGLGTTARLNARLAPSWVHRAILVDAGVAGAGSSRQAARAGEDSGAAMQELPNNGQHWSESGGVVGGSVERGRRGPELSRAQSADEQHHAGWDRQQRWRSGRESRGDRGGNGFATAQSAVGAFQVSGNGFSAEYGRAAGGAINTVTKSGSNHMHGQAVFYDRGAIGQASTRTAKRCRWSRRGRR